MAEMKLDNAAVRAIQVRLANGEAVRSIVKAFPVSPQVIYSIKSGKRKEHVGHVADADIEQAARQRARDDWKHGYHAIYSNRLRKYATTRAIHYFIQFPEMYRRATSEEALNAFEQWMNLYIGWYEDESTGKKSG